MSYGIPDPAAAHSALAKRPHPRDGSGVVLFWLTGILGVHSRMWDLWAAQARGLLRRRVPYLRFGALVWFSDVLAQFAMAGAGAGRGYRATLALRQKG